MAKATEFGTNGTQINENITAIQVRVVGSDGEMLGIMDTVEAIRIAYDADMDLVMMNQDADPPVCRIMDYGKYKYDLQKKKAESKKKQKVVTIKEVQLRPMIGENDLLIKCKAAEKFLRAGNKVKVAMRLRGREMSRQELGISVVQKLLDFVAEISKDDCKLKIDGQTITAIVSPK